MSTNRLQEKNGFFIRLGALFGPLQHLAENPDLYDEQEKVETIARYFSDYQSLLMEFGQFCDNQSGHTYLLQKSNFQQAVEGVARDLREQHSTLPEFLNTRLAQAQDAINAIPIPRDSTIFEAGTPFSTYCMLKDLCEADTAKELIWVDAYLDMNVFHRFLRGVTPNATITLVTSEPRSNAGTRDRTRWNEFLDISRLFALERGNVNYQLVVHQSLLHDRWLLLDKKRLYSFGGSAKDAGSKQYFTVARMDAATNLQTIQAHVSSGTEFFGPNTPQHA